MVGVSNTVLAVEALTTWMGPDESRAVMGWWSK